jgi:hypothetical protein
MGERFQIEAGIIEQSLRIGIRGEEYLKSAIEEEAVDFVGANATADGVGGFKNLKGDILFVKGTRTGESG